MMNSCSPVSVVTLRALSARSWRLGSCFSLRPCDKTQQTVTEQQQPLLPLVIKPTSRCDRCDKSERNRQPEGGQTTSP